MPVSGGERGAMASGGNGDLHTPITRRARVDPGRRVGEGDPGLIGPGHSGRVFVIAAALAVVVIGALLGAAFLKWRARHRELAAFGRLQVAPVVEPLALLEPPGVEVGEWRTAVAQTRAMLEAVTAAGLLDRPQMEALRDELRGKVARATPATSIVTLRSIWDDLERRAGPVLNREFLRPPRPQRRPEILQYHNFAEQGPEPR